MRYDPVFFCNSFGYYPYWYQEQVLWCDARRVVINMSRQIGKTFAVALLALHFVFTRAKVNVLIVAPAQRQSEIMFETIEEIINSHPILQDSVKKIIQGKIRLENGSTIYNFPIGDSAKKVRGHAIHLLIADEASFIPNIAFTALTPSLGATKGRLIMISTPDVRGGFFYEHMMNGLDYKDWHASDKKMDHIGQAVRFWFPYSVGLDAMKRNLQGEYTGETQMDEEFIIAERNTKHPTDFAREYLAQFVDEGAMFFPRALIVNATEDYPMQMHPLPDCDYYMGTDFAKLRDYYISLVLEKPHLPDHAPFKVVHWQQSKNIDYSWTVPETARIARHFGVKVLYCDSTGVGEVNVEKLKELLLGYARVEGVNMTSHQKQLDMYTNVYEMLGSGKLILPVENKEFLDQMLAVTRTKLDSGRIKIEAIAGMHDDYPDSLALGCMSTSEPRMEMFAASLPSITRHDAYVKRLRIAESMGERIIPEKSTDLIRDPDTDSIIGVRGIRRRTQRRGRSWGRKY